MNITTAVNEFLFLFVCFLQRVVDENTGQNDFLCPFASCLCCGVSDNCIFSIMGIWSLFFQYALRGKTVNICIIH